MNIIQKWYSVQVPKFRTGLYIFFETFQRRSFILSSCEQFETLSIEKCFKSAILVERKVIAAGMLILEFQDKKFRSICLVKVTNKSYSISLTSVCIVDIQLQVQKKCAFEPSRKMVSFISRQVSTLTYDDSLIHCIQSSTFTLYFLCEFYYSFDIVALFVNG